MPSEEKLLPHKASVSLQSQKRLQREETVPITTPQRQAWSAMRDQKYERYKKAFKNINYKIKRFNYIWRESSTIS